MHPFLLFLGKEITPQSVSGSLSLNSKDQAKSPGFMMAISGDFLYPTGSSSTMQHKEMLLTLFLQNCI